MTNILQFKDIVPQNIFTKSGNKTYELEIYENKKLLIRNTKDRYYGFYTQEHVLIPNNKLCLIYSWPAGRNQHINKNLGKRYKHLIIPKEIPLDKLTLNAMGLLQAEMTKYKLRFSNVIFSNRDKNSINTILHFFKMFGINPEQWKWNITFNYKLKQIELSEEIENRECEALKHWFRNTKINSNQKDIKIFYYTGNKKYKNIRLPVTQYGCLKVYYSNIILYQLIYNLIKNIEIRLNNTQEIIYYMQGLIAGEGNVKLTKTKSLDSVRIGCLNNNEKKIYKKLLGELDIKSKIEKNDIVIHNRNNFIKIFKYGLIRLNMTKYHQFLKAFSMFKYNASKDINYEFLKCKNSVKDELNMIEVCV